jgi:hypothetical protein
MPVDSPFTWNPERVARLRELVATGMSSAAIAAVLHTLRSAVCGARLRHGIPTAPRPPRERQPEPARPARWTQTARSAASTRAAWSIWPASPRLMPESLPEPDPLDLTIAGVPLLELETGDCRWPLPEPADGVARRFCGEPAGRGCAYCARHHVKSIRFGYSHSRGKRINENGRRRCRNSGGSRCRA